MCDLPFIPLLIILLVTGIHTSTIIKAIKGQYLTRLMLVKLTLILIGIVIMLLLSLADIILLCRAVAVVKTLHAYISGHTSDLTTAKQVGLHTLHTLKFPLFLAKLLLITVTVYKIRDLDTTDFFCTSDAFTNTDTQSSLLVVAIIQDSAMLILLICCSPCVWRFIPYIKSSRQ